MYSSLRLKQQRFRVKFPSDSHVGLGAERGSMGKLLLQHASGLGAGRQQFLRYAHHLLRSFQFVVRCLHRQLDIVGQSRKVLFCL